MGGWLSVGLGGWWLDGWLKGEWVAEGWMDGWLKVGWVADVSTALPRMNDRL